jgi:dihydroxyacetone kinase-like protein
MIDKLDLSATKSMFLHMAEEMVAAKEILTKADQAIGDGDHGIGMARGFEAVEEKLADQEFSSLDLLLKATGMALISSIGGAAGAIFGTLFRAGSNSLAECTSFDAEALAKMLEDGLVSVQARGGAKPGDKTMIDALAPAAQAAAANRNGSLTEAANAAAQAARDGMEKTRGMTAKTGKAKTLGERSLGHPDPGAISMTLILDAFCNYLKGAGQTG